MNDRPTAAELVAAARQYLESELIPTLTDARLRFQTLVAANVLTIVERELLGEEGQLLEELETLKKWLDIQVPPPQRLTELRQAVQGANKELCRQIQAGEFDQETRFRDLAQQLRRVVEQKLEVANPRYLANFPTAQVTG